MALDPVPLWATEAYKRVSCRERSRSAKPSLSPRKVFDRFVEQGGCCSNCGVRFILDRTFRHRDAPQVDRINTLLPRYRSNFTMLCAWCNIGKSGFDLLDQIRADYDGGKRLPTHGTCAACNLHLPQSSFHSKKYVLDDVCKSCKGDENLTIQTIGMRANKLRRFVTRKHGHPAIDAEKMWRDQDGRCSRCGVEMSLIHRSQTLAAVCPDNYDRLYCFKCQPTTCPWKRCELLRDKG